MPRLFESTDISENVASITPKEDTSRLFEITDAGTWTMNFDKESTEDIQRLMKLMPKARKPEDVVYTALQILALAVGRDLVIEGKNKGTPKKVSGLWQG